jgi:hypothetical protein
VEFSKFGVKIRRVRFFTVFLKRFLAQVCFGAAGIEILNP